jgi:beta-lactamase regulating signal transducer with metallopeptidase domain
VILSSGLIEGLSEYELTMVVRHELAHLRRRHHRHLMVAAVVEATFGWLPLVSSSAQAMRLGVERWADEEAAGTDPRARRTLGSALVTAAGCRPQPGVAGFGDVEMAVERLKALETTPPAGLSRWWYPFVGIVTTAAASLGVASMAVVGISLGSSGICNF